MKLVCFISVLVFLPSTYEQELRVEPNQNSVFLPPRNELPTQTSLSCRLQVTPPGQRLFVEWVVQNGETSTHFFVRFGILRNGYSMLLIGDETFLFIDDLSYKRAGNYTCRARLTADVLSPFKFATISLSLKHKLEISPAAVLVSNDTRHVEMRCEMSQYIEPDGNLRWFKDGLEISSDGQKYEIQLGDGDTNDGVVNGRFVPSRVSVLVVLDFELYSDTGCYYCKTVGSSQRSESVLVSSEEQDPFLCKELPTLGSSVVIAKESVASSPSPSSTDIISTASLGYTPSPTPGFPDTNTGSPTTSPGGNGGGGEEDQQSPRGVGAVAVTIPAGSVGFVLLFSAVLLTVICCLRCHRKKLGDGNTGGGFPDTGVSSITVWSDDFSPPVPSGPRQNLHRVSQNSAEYYMNEGEDPEKPYQSIPPYLSMASFSAHQCLQVTYLNPANGAVPDEGKTAKPEEEYVFIPSGPDGNNDENNNNEYVEMSGKSDEVEDRKCMNTGEAQNSDSAENLSNNEYVVVPSTTQRPASPTNILATGDISSSADHRQQPDSSILPSENQDHTYDKLSSQ